MPSRSLWTPGDSRRRSTWTCHWQQQDSRRLHSATVQSAVPEGGAVRRRAPHSRSPIGSPERPMVCPTPSGAKVVCRRVGRSSGSCAGRWENGVPPAHIRLAVYRSRSERRRFSLLDRRALRHRPMTFSRSVLCLGDYADRDPKTGAALQRRHQRTLTNRRDAREPARPFLVERFEL
jgi:hypothetical protein